MQLSAQIKRTPLFLFWLLLLVLPVQLGRHFWLQTSLVLGIRIDYLSPTFYFSDLVIFLLLASWAAKLLVEKKKLDKKIVIVIFIFPLSLLICTIFSPIFQNSLYYVAKIWEMSLLCLFISQEIEFKGKITKVLAFLSIGVFWQSILGIFQFIYQRSAGLWVLGERSFNAQTPGISLVNLDGAQFLRPYGTFPHPNVLGGFLAILLPAFLLLFLAQKQKNLFLLSSVLLGFVALTLAFSRTSWFVGFGLSLIIIGRFALRSRVKLSGKFLLSVFGIFLVFIFTLPYFIQRITSFSTTDSHSLILRLKLTSSAFLMFKSYPVFGVGPGNFLSFLPRFFDLKETIRWIQPVHNVFLLTLAESGILGLFFFLTLFFYPIFELLKVMKKNVFAKIILIWFLAIYILASFDHYFLTLQQGQLIFWIFLGLSWSFIKSNNFGQNTPKTVLE